MDAKTLRTLEYNKVLERLATYTGFAVSKEKAQKLTPSTDLETVRRTLAETGEARQIFETHPQITIGGARDIREIVKGAGIGKVLDAANLIDIKSTLISARTLQRQLNPISEQIPHLAELADQLPEPMGLVDAITKTISDRGDILDSASPDLKRIRRQLQTSHDRLVSRMQKMLNNDKIAPYLQEALVTQRDGRYVIPVRAEFKGKVKSVVHDVSSSGATLFVEPLQVVDLNNAWKELQLAERDEELKVLIELSAQIGQNMIALQTAVEVLADLDVIFARAKYADVLRASEPQIEKFKPVKNSKDPGLTLHLWQARHPLLEMETVVPVDVELAEGAHVLVITGPNTGGKTVTLKTVGLLALMAQTGLHIPVQPGSKLSLFDAVYADIGDEQSIEQSLSTFSAHITNITNLLDKAGKKSLVILDELGSGTDPQEGAALAMSILDYLVTRGIPTLVATHYPELKAYAHSAAGVVNASMEFDLESLKPTYHLIIGLPGRSNALAIAKRLGLKEEIIEAARGEIDPAELRAEDLLNEIHRQRDLTRTAREAADSARDQAEKLRADLAERLENIEDERLDVISKTRQDAQIEIDALQEEIAKTRRDLARARQPLESLETIQEQIEQIEGAVSEPVERQQVVEEIEDAVYRQIRLGDRVYLRILDQQGIVISLTEEEAEVQVGNLRVRIDIYALEYTESKEELPTEKTVDTNTPKVASPGIELSLRGQLVEEARPNLDYYLEQAFLAGLPYVRVIHGKGTGKLRNMVRGELKKHPHVDRFEPGGPTEGGDGVTIVFFRSS